MLRANRFQVVEIPVATGSTSVQFSFPDLPQLTGLNGFPVCIQSVVMFSSDLVSLSPLSQSAVVAPADFTKSYLSIYQGDLLTINNMPLSLLSPVQNRNDNTTPFVSYQPVLNNMINISWTKSFIRVPTALATTGVVYLIGIYYNVAD